MAYYNIALIGFGNVGQALAVLLLRKRGIMQERYGLSFSVTGIATSRHGSAIDPAGIDLEQALKISRAGGSFNQLSVKPIPRTEVEYYSFSPALDTFAVKSVPQNKTEFIRACPADILLEISPVNHSNGQPAIDHLLTALDQGMHVITANKGPVVHGYRLLKEKAHLCGRRFLYEATVMDGAPIFSMFRESLPALELKSFRGILNSCTNLILTRMENGETLERAVAYAQSIGIAETDPSADIDGWDSAIKVAALITVLMDIPFTPQMVHRVGIRDLTPFMLAEAGNQRKRWKLVCTGCRNGTEAVGQVALEMVAPDSPLYSINGTSSYIQFETDILPGLGVVDCNPGPETAALGLLNDLLNTVR